MKKAARGYTLFVGYFLLIQGSLTLAFNLFPALDRAFPYLLRYNPMSPLHSTLHTATGILAMISLYRFPPKGPTWFAFLFGVFYTSLGYFGPHVHETLHLHLQNYDHPIHFVIGMGGMVAAFVSIQSQS
jgi:hypothetical protein